MSNKNKGQKGTTQEGTTQEGNTQEDTENAKLTTIAELEEEALADKAKEEEEAEEEIKEGSVTIVNNGKYPHRDPYAKIRFSPGVRVSNIVPTSWMRCQIKAGLLTVVD